MKRRNVLDALAHIDDEEGLEAAEDAEDGFDEEMIEEIDAVLGELENAPARALRPDHIPEKFWDPDGEQVRVDDMARSYSQLERKLHGLGKAGRLVPDKAGDYQITVPEDLLTPDPDVNAKLHQAGFTQRQAQLVYDLATERLAPLVRDMAADTVADAERRKVAEEFGGEDKFQRLAPRISNWGKANLPPHVFDALSSSAQGIHAMHQMMQSEEPILGGPGQTPKPGMSEVDLKRMMDDPKYWRDRDPAVFRRVEDGFRRLYPDER